jgi:hypothetical protein
MTNAPTQAPPTKSRKVAAKRHYGRSPATGMYVLVPVIGKDSTITQEQANTVFQRIYSSK